MDSREMKPGASPPPWRPPGAGSRAWPKRDNRRDLPPPPPPHPPRRTPSPPPPRRAPPPPPARRPPPPPPGHTANAPRGEGRSAVRWRGEAEGAGAGDTRRGTARREARRNAEAVAEPGAREAGGLAEERRNDGTGRKRWTVPLEHEQPPPKERKTARRGSGQAPPDYWKEIAVPLGRNRNADNSRPRASRADGGSGAPGKATPRPPLAASKEGVRLGEALSHAAGTSVPNKVPAAGSARPLAVGGRHGGDMKSSEALRQSNVAAADGLRDTGSQGAAGSTVKDRGRGAGTGELQRKEQVPFKRLPPQPAITAERRLGPGSRSNAGSLLGRGSRESQLPLEARYADGGSGPSKLKDHLKSKTVPEIDRMNTVSSDVPARLTSQTTMTGNKIVHAPGNFGPKMKGTGKAPDHPLINVVRALDSGEKLDCKVAFSLKDDDVLKAIGICDEELKLYISNSSNCPPLGSQKQHEVHNADARRKFKMICRRFEFICRVLVQAVERHLLNPDRGRIDTIADRAMKELPDFSKPGPIVGKVPGIEVGDVFQYRVQLAVAGLHRWSRGGIDWTKNSNGTSIAVSIVCSGGYPDEMLCSGELIYTGSGGKFAGKNHDGNQKLKRGNLALKNCIDTATPVRVIYGLKSHNVEGQCHSRAKEIPAYIYDGLYKVVSSKEAGEKGSIMFKYRLKKIPGQPELPLHIAKRMMKPKMRPDLCMDDISECMGDVSKQKEGIPICVINTVDNATPASFTYITRIESALCPNKVRPLGCGCTNGCSDSDSCFCARKNGGKFPFNSNGAIVSESPLIFECGPSCKCPPSCHNRVSQHGIKIPLEVFRTNKTGWGVRSLRSISSGSFICEYVGELRHSMEADQRKNSNYLFNIGHSKGSQPRVSDLKSSGTCSGTMDVAGFTIDATKCGNVGRFINHSCSPNLFAQNVLFDHVDKRMAHIMFFAAETIPPLQELTCDYK